MTEDTQLQDASLRRQQEELLKVTRPRRPDSYVAARSRGGVADRSGHYAAGTYFAERRPEHTGSQPRPRDLAEWMTESHPSMLSDGMIIVFTVRPKRKSARTRASPGRAERHNA